MFFVTLNNSTFTTTTLQPTFTALTNASKVVVQPIHRYFSENITQDNEEYEEDIKLSYILGATSLMAISSVILYIVLRRRERNMTIDDQVYTIEPVVYPI